MFVTEATLKKVLLEALTGTSGKAKAIKELTLEIEKLKKQIKELELTKKMEEREIKQLVKIKQEQQDIEYQKKEVQLKGDFAQKERDLMKTYHDKQVEQINIASKEMKEVYQEIMKRLPDITASLELTAGGKKKGK